MSNLTNLTNQESASSETNEDKVKRAEEFMKHVASQAVPSGIRPDLAPPGPECEGGDGGGVGSSI